MDVLCVMWAMAYIVMDVSYSIVPWSSIQLQALAASTMCLKNVLIIHALPCRRYGCAKCCNKSIFQSLSYKDDVFCRLNDFLAVIRCFAETGFSTRSFIQ